MLTRTDGTTGALSGVRVIDFSQVMAGPYCTMLLADMGADVIKIEPPEGDSSRKLVGGHGTESAGFWAVNRNKRSVVVNLKDRKGAEVCRRLAGGPTSWWKTSGRARSSGWGWAMRRCARCIRV
jgi:formyl-CoA transferase